VEAMLRKVVGRKKVDPMLSGKFPHRVEFANHQSLYTHWSFAKGEVRKLVLWTAASIIYDPEEALVINPMGVVESAGKFRLICNARYINLFLQSLPFKYQKLRDILAFTEEGSFMVTWDLKSGYFHVPIHPKYRKYFAFRIGGVTFAFNVLCFGFAQACYVFTKVMQEPVVELRKLGIPLSDYIDDSFSAARTKGRCLRQSMLSAQFFTNLGAFFGLPKCQFDPVQLLKWLGFMVDSKKQEFRLSDSKVAKLKEICWEATQTSETTPRKLAAMAGRIIAASPAVLPAALFSRALFGAIQGKETWDTVFPNPESVKETARFWLENLDRYNGRRWWPRQTTAVLTVDASGVGYGGQVELNETEPVQFTGTFTREQAQASSTEREIIGYGAGLATVAQIFPEELAGSSVLLLGDNQGGISAINKMRSSVLVIWSALKDVLELCSAFQFDLTARWIPRTRLQEADALSREPDATDWGIDKEILADITRHFQVRITLDLFASDAHHVCERFISLYYTPGSLAVHALKLDWNQFATGDPNEVFWIFPPAGCASLALSLLGRFKVDALICICVKEGSPESIQLNILINQGARVSSGYGIPRAASCCKPSLRVPTGIINPAFLGLTVFLITW
jgi:hypothetical protein